MSKHSRSADDGADSSPRENDQERLAARHLRFGWCTLLVFLTMGIVLEFLHGFKVGWYLEGVTRRHMWTLAHAHGTLLSLIHLAFAASIPRLDSRDLRWRHVASPCLYAATLTLPAGFFLGGIYVYSGDPGVGISLVPLGGVLLLIAVGLIARAVRRSSN